MSGQGSKAAAALAAILVALQLGACGGGSDTTETTSADSGESAPESGVRPSAWNNVNEGLRGDILSFGKKGSQAKLEEATAVLRGYLTARVDGNPSKACSYLSEYMLNVMKGSAQRRGEHGCVAGMEGLETLSSVDEAEGPLRISPRSIRSGSRGRRTFVIYEDGYGDTYAMLMRHVGGTWKIQGFEPTRLS